MAASTRQKRDPNEAPTLFSAIMANLGPGRSPEARRHNLEVILGIMGFFALMSLIQLVAAELRGDAPAGYAVATAVLLGATYLVFRKWHKAGGWSSGPDRRR